MKVDLDYLREVYFTFNKPVEFTLKSEEKIFIYPILLEDSAIFNSSYPILTIDKNSSTDPEIISMSYLKFLLLKMLPQDMCKQQLFNICKLCLHMNTPFLKMNEKERPVLFDIDEESKLPNSFITQKDFDDIKKIILYQNLPYFDDGYINPELKKAMQEQDELKAKGIEFPSLERKINIIAAHTGIKPEDQYKMTLRSHTLLFSEVVGEVNYQSMKAISLYAGKADTIEWIYPKAKGKFDEYITSVEEYNKSFGGNGSIQSTSPTKIQNLNNLVEK